MNISWSKQVCVFKKHIHNTSGLTLNCLFLPKYRYKSIITLPPNVLSHSNSPTYLFRTVFVFTCKQFLICVFFSTWFRQDDFSTGESNIMHIDDLYFSFSLELKPLIDGFVSHKHSFSLHKSLIDGLDRCGLLEVYYDVFISLDSHSDGTHSLKRIHWWACYISPNLFHKETNSSWMNWGWEHFQPF